MRLAICLALIVLFSGCAPKKPLRRLPTYKKQVAPLIAASDSVLTVTAPADDLKGIQRYVGDGNSITLSKSMHFDLGKTKIDLPTGTNAAFANSGDSVAIVFNSPKPVVTTKVGPFIVHPLLEKLMIQPDGTVDATAKEMGKTVEKKAIIRWSAESSDEDLEFEKEPPQLPEVKKTFKPEAETVTVPTRSTPTPIALLPQEQLNWHTPYFVYIDGIKYNTPVKHLITQHGYSEAQLAGLTQDQLNRVHGWAHMNSKPGVTTTASVSPQPTIVSGQPCPGGVCPRKRGRR